MASKILLTKDVVDLGRSGDLVTVKEGYARNYLIPQQLGMLADKNTLRMQAKLQEERKKKAAEDLKGAKALAQTLEGVVLTTIVKVDHEGHMYGSVSANDIVHLLHEQKNITLDKKWIQLKHAIKATGEHKIELKLLEGVPAELELRVLSEEQSRKLAEAETATGQ